MKNAAAGGDLRRGVARSVLRFVSGLAIVRRVLAP